MKNILGLHQKLTSCDAAVCEWGGSMFSLVLRLFVGSQFLRSGMTKLHDWSATLALFQDEYHVPLLAPELAAWLGTFGELALPMLLFAGFLSRPAALGLFLLNVVAVASYPQLFSFDCPAAINDHIYWGILLLVLAIFGPGRFSVDTALATKYRDLS